MGQQISRRSFLKGGLAAAAAVAKTSIPGATAIAKPDAEKQLATLLDISKCVGCEACVDACSEANSEKYPDAKKPFPKMYPNRVPVEDWSEEQDVTDRLTPYNWLFIQHAEVEIYGEETELTIPRRCMHCVNPPCVKLCPWGAARQLENGISRIDSDNPSIPSFHYSNTPWNSISVLPYLQKTVDNDSINEYEKEKRFHGRSSCSMRLGKTAGQTSEWGSETAFKAKEITHE